jgi:hypothetical protein
MGVGGEIKGGCEEEDFDGTEKWISPSTREGSVLAQLIGRVWIRNSL